VSPGQEDATLTSGRTESRSWVVSEAEKAREEVKCFANTPATACKGDLGLMGAGVKRVTRKQSRARSRSLSVLFFQDSVPTSVHLIGGHRILAFSGYPPLIGGHRYLPSSARSRIGASPSCCMRSSWPRNN
jgi:hypothetical protein